MFNIQKIVCGLECSNCEKKFSSTQELGDHIEEHLEEIEQMDVEYFKKGHESFICNKCNFNSNDIRKIKIHLSIHIRNYPTSAQAESIKKMTEPKAVRYKETESDPKVKKYNWRDDFDEFGNYLGPETSDEDTDT